MRWSAERVIFVVLAVVLGVLWVSFLFVDVLDAFGVRTYLFVEPGILRSDRPALFDRLAADNGPVEWFQWGFLASGVIAAGMAAGLARSRGLGDATSRVLWFAVALAVLAIEDPGDVRNQISRFGRELAGDLGGQLGELAVFGAVGLVAVVALWRLWPIVNRRPSLRLRVLLGYAVYALAGAMSATDWWYPVAGDWVRDVVLRGAMLPYHNAGYFIFDHLIEESLELTAISLIVSTAWSLSRAEFWRERGESELLSSG